ncbi:agamous-like MADS-box protein MADS2 [Apium graveolens]|uniref:agamous-like MADS-box protein MADS2 n=1 Tax=Apium graveolens TaxID=4045 RepID=UPI003D793C8E
MGRGKIEIKSVEDTSSGFSTRHNGLLKKAHELSVLCDAEVAVIIFSSTGQLYHFASSSMDQVLSRYNKCLRPSEASVAQPEAQKKSSDDLTVLKEEVAQLMQRQTILLGNDVTEYGLNELQQLEQLLNDGLLSVRDRKEQLLMAQLEQSRMKEKQIILENEQLRKQIGELQSYLPTSVQEVPYLLGYRQEELGLPETHGALSHDKIYTWFQEKQILPENRNFQKQLEEIQSYLPMRVPPVPRFLESSQQQTSLPEIHGAISHDKFYPCCVQENQIMLENKDSEDQFEELQSFLPTRDQPDSHFMEYSKENIIFPETHSALGPDAVSKGRAQNVGLFTTLLLGSPSRDQRKRKEPEQKTAEKESFPGASEHQFDM